jgi:hypothetical protein
MDHWNTFPQDSSLNRKNWNLLFETKLADRLRHDYPKAVVSYSLDYDATAHRFIPFSIRVDVSFFDRNDRMACIVSALGDNHFN